MAKHPSIWRLPARSLWVLALALSLSGCTPVGLDERVISGLEGITQAGEVPAESAQVEIFPSPTVINETQEALSPAPEATRTAVAVAQTAQRVVRTMSARVTATQAALQALEGQSATAVEGATSDGAATAVADVAITPSPGPEDALPPTPTPASLLARFFEPFASFEGVLPGLLADLRMSPDGILWVINENGIASLKGSTWTVHFPDVNLWLAGFDDAGRTWVLNEQGTAVLSWNGSEWRIYGDREGWQPVQTQRSFQQGEEMVSDRTGRVWMTAYQDVRSFDGVEWTVHNLREIGFEPFEETAQTNGFYFPALEKDLEGNIWIGNCDFRGEEIAGQGARWFDGNTWQGNSEPTASGCVQDIAVGADGRVWMGIDELLWRYDPKARSWTRFELPEQPADTRIGWIQDIRFGPDGNPWLAAALCGGASCGSTYGSYRLEEEKWVTVPHPEEYDPGSQYIDPGGNAWQFFEEQLFLVRGNTREKVLGVDICAITQDSRGWLYLAARQDRMKLIFVERGGR